MKIIVFILMAILPALSLSGQRGEIVPGSYVPGRAAAAYTGRWQPMHNPSAAAVASHTELSVTYENRYITRELSNKMVAAVVPTPYFNVSAAFNHFGYSVYNEMLAAVGFSRDFGGWRVGVEADVYMVYLSPTERYAATVTANVGAQVDVSPAVTLGFSMFNPCFSAVRSSPVQNLPVTVAVGVNWHIHDKVDWLVELDREISTLFHWKTGFEYRPFDVFTLRAGVYGADYAIPTLGVGFSVDDFRFEFHSELNPRLGVTLLGSLGYDI